MRQRLLILFALCTLGLHTVTAQTLLQGKIIDQESDNPLEFATLSLYSSTDSSLITGTITDIDGNYELSVSPGTYRLKAEFISYQEQWIDDVRVTGSDRTTDLGTIRLRLSAAMLAEIEITGEKSQFQLGLDKKIFNVDKDLVTRGGTAADVLDNIPSISVDLEGNVSLRGSQGVRILVDGRPSGLAGISGNALNTLRGDMIERVEVITNPSARYEAEGMAGIINIILKKEQQKGVNGAFGLTAGYPANFGGSANVNFRQKNFNLFLNYGLQYYEAPGGGKLYQEYYNGDTLYLEQTNDRVRAGISHNLRLGTDYFINDNNVLTGALIYRYSDRNNNTSVMYRDLNTQQQLTAITLRDEVEDEISPFLEYSFNYKRTFKRQGHTLSASFQYQDNSETELSDYKERAFNPDLSPAEIPDLFQRSDNAEADITRIAQIDYMQPLGKDGKFEAGLRTSIRDIRTDFLIEELRNGVWDPLENLGNRFLYDEDIHAAYLIYGNKFNQISFQAGLRAEYSHVVTELLETQEINDRDYTNLFPSLHVGYELRDNNTLQVSYSRRVNRPRFHMLNPFLSFTDARNRWGGNPNLDPEFTDAYELGHIKYWDKSSLTSSIYFRRTTNVVDRIRTISEGITETTPQNLLNRDDTGFEFTFAKDIVKSLRIDGNLNLFYSIIRGGQFGTAENFNWQSRINSRILLAKNIESQIRLNYRGPQDTPQGRNRSVYHMDFGVSTDIMQGRGTLTLNVSDVFNTRLRRYETFGQGFYSEGEWQWRARQTTLNFSYRLNQRKERRERGEGERGGDDMDMF